MPRVNFDGSTVTGSADAIDGLPNVIFLVGVTVIPAMIGGTLVITGGSRFTVGTYTVSGEPGSNSIETSTDCASGRSSTGLVGYLTYTASNVSSTPPNTTLYALAGMTGASGDTASVGLFAHGKLSASGSLSLFAATKASSSGTLSLSLPDVKDSVHNSFPLFSWGKSSLATSVNLVAPQIDLEANKQLTLFAAVKSSSSGSVSLSAPHNTTSAANQVSLFAHGLVGFSGPRTLYCGSGVMPNPFHSGVTLYAHGVSFASGHFPLYSYSSTGSGVSFLPTLFAWVVNPESNSFPLYAHGYSPSSGTMTLYNNASVPVSSSTPLYAIGVPTLMQSGALQLFAKSAVQPTDSSITLYALTPNVGAPDADMPLWAMGEALRSDASLTLFACNIAAGSGLTLFARGLGGAPGSLPYSSSMNLYLKRFPAEMITLYAGAPGAPAISGVSLSSRGSGPYSTQTTLSLPDVVGSPVGTVPLSTRGF